MNELIISHILRDASDGIIVLSLNGTITFINPFPEMMNFIRCSWTASMIRNMSMPMM